MNIPERWIPLLDTLNDKDLATLIRAILHNEDEPTVSKKNQAIIHSIYSDLSKVKRNNEYQKKFHSKSYNNLNLILEKDLNNIRLRQEEKREVSPPCSPSSFPPHPLINSPYNPPLEEKREEALTGVCAGAEEQIPFTAFEPLDPIEPEVKQRKPTIQERFESLWEEYPKKNGKKNAYESYKRAITAGVADETIADGIRRYKNYIAAKHMSEQYILAGSTYFYQWRWQDEYNAVSAAPTCRENSGGDEFLNYLNEELEKENAKRESRWTEQT